ncbi:protein of unknown function [Moritella yayanosii]|uniref:Uncharacterized protein n=1 Tax=Moritella yayanosii TaxID=69539 RepID=A0A330LV86_9GAMM|nr:protein of unknown function [Moritella yayanosii]
MWFEHVLIAKEPLRQRVALALSQNISGLE